MMRFSFVVSALFISVTCIACGAVSEDTPLVGSSEDADAGSGVSSDGDVDPAGGVAGDSVAQGAGTRPGSACWAGLQLCEGDGVITCLDGTWSEIIPCNSGTCVDGSCIDCTPTCEGKVCGPDGCGDTCGACAEGASVSRACAVGVNPSAGSASAGMMDVAVAAAHATQAKIAATVSAHASLSARGENAARMDAVGPAASA